VSGRVNTDVWLYGFSAADVSERPFGGKQVRVKVAAGEHGEHGVSFVFGEGVMPLDEQVAACRRAAEVFASVAGRLEASLAGGGR